MDYEKEYKEALERMRNVIIPPETKEGLQALKETVFPELAESEDEMMRKSLIEYLKTKDHECDHWIAYLEKQKEQNRAERTINKWAGSKRGLPPGTRTMFPIKGDDDLDLALDILQRTLGQVDGYQSDDGILEHKRAIMAVTDAMNAKPAEWSDDDEKMLVSILWHVSYSVSNGKQTDCHCDLTDWLKALPERLKSLRPQPQWKPSEEQMAILDKVYHYLWADRNATADMQDGLGDLIEDLKNL